MIFIVSQVAVSDGVREDAKETPLGRMSVQISKARGTKCDRCWNYSEQVGKDPEHPSLCGRCVPVISTIEKG
jgi:isoleucyl-tRNA synthetase